jgi:transposase
MFSVELYGRVRHACHVEGLSQREAARRFGIHRNTVRKMLAFSVPPGYRRTSHRPAPSSAPSPRSSTRSWRPTAQHR